MKKKELQKLFKKNKSNAGFTLTELLVGLIMSTIVIGAAGWGLMQILVTTSTETTRVSARNETSRAFSFVADEVRAAQFMEVDMSDSNINAVASDYQSDAISGASVRLALQVPGVQQRIIYSVAPPPSGSVWKGPLVIYRWGPNLDAKGAYTDPNNPLSWGNEPLIDNVSDASQTANCGGTDVTYEGFYACVLDNDGDGQTENLTDTNGDGKINKDDAGAIDKNGDGAINNDDGADTDGVSITAQLYFVGKTEKGEYKADSQIVARARIAPEIKEEFKKPNPVYFQSLNPQYGVPGCWTVRNDFGQGEDPRFDPNSANTTQKAKALKNVMTWVHKDNRQTQPLNIDSTKPFTMVASAFTDNPDPVNDSCLAKGNRFKQKLVSINDDGSGGSYGYVKADGTDAVNATDKVRTTGKEAIHTYENKVWHTLEFPDADDSDAEKAEKLASFNGSATDNPDVKGDETIYMFRNGSTVPDAGGYDVDGDGDYEPSDGDQPSIRDFLAAKGLVDADGKATGLQPNQRIVAFEIGQTEKTQNGSPTPGFDLQDSTFIMTSDALVSSNYQ
jgi:type II secretory pathway component PulJ